MLAVQIVSVVIYISTLFACIRFIRSGTCRNVDLSIVSALAASCAFFVIINILHIIWRSTTIIDLTLWDRMVIAFLLLNGFIYLNIIRAYSHFREGRKQQDHQPQ